mmetsp:Transcript_29232/g.83036  ORF Transcript_29232/g.83036 Transcript_29232/m.83036 type:complete len:218 (-) Transcript_29232:281-934(-)
MLSQRQPGHPVQQPEVAAAPFGDPWRWRRRCRRPEPDAGSQVEVEADRRSRHTTRPDFEGARRHRSCDPRRRPGGMLQHPVRDRGAEACFGTHAARQGHAVNAARPSKVAPLCSDGQRLATAAAVGRPKHSSLSTEMVHVCTFHPAGSGQASSLARGVPAPLRLNSAADGSCTLRCHRRCGLRVGRGGGSEHARSEFGAALGGLSGSARTAYSIPLL